MTTDENKLLGRLKRRRERILHNVYNARPAHELGSDRQISIRVFNQERQNTPDYKTPVTHKSIQDLYEHATKNRR
jgi:hypothetical protein